MKDTYDVINLSSSEWGNEYMERVAREYFEANPAVDFVDVIEHGGWHLGFRRDGSLWTTANDMAVLRHPQPMPKRYSGVTIRRPDQCKHKGCDKLPGHVPGHAE